MNPFDVLPTHIRAYVYAGLALAAIVLAGFRAADGDWLEAATYILGALGFGQAKAKTPTGGTAKD